MVLFLSTLSVHHFATFYALSVIRRKNLEQTDLNKKDLKCKFCLMIKQTFVCIVFSKTGHLLFSIKSVCFNFLQLSITDEANQLALIAF